MEQLRRHRLQPADRLTPAVLCSATGCTERLRVGFVQRKSRKQLPLCFPMMFPSSLFIFNRQPHLTLDKIWLHVPVSFLQIFSLQSTTMTYFAVSIDMTSLQSCRENLTVIAPRHKNLESHPEKLKGLKQKWNFGRQTFHEYFRPV